MFLQNRFFRLGLYSCFFAFSIGALGAVQTASAKAPTTQCTQDKNHLEQLKNERKGMFRMLRIAEKPLYMGDYQFRDENEKVKKISDYKGKTLLINMWGVWCPPCRAEITDLAELQDDMGGKNFEVLTIHDQASSKAKVKTFLKEQKAEDLPRHYDPGMEFYGKLKREGLARGFPVSLVVNKDGCLVASLNGAAPWASGDAKDFIKAVDGK